MIAASPPPLRTAKASGLPEDGTGLAEAIRNGEVTAVAAMEAAIAAAVRHAGFGALTWQDAEAGLAKARAFDAARGADRRALEAVPFAGLPFLVKDLGSAFTGMPLHAGSEALARRFGPSRADSDLAARFRASGFLPFGRTSVPEFGLSLASEPAAFPPVRNPLNPALTAGGSSGGAAAAVALGIVPVAHATDAGGSIRVPAACCGLVGLKPSRGAVPEGPEFGNHLAGLAAELVVARSVRDVRASLLAVSGAVRGPMPDVAFAPARHPLRIGLLRMPGVESERAAAVVDAARHLESLGSSVEPVESAAFEEMAESSIDVFDHVVASALAATFEALRIEPGEVEPLTAAVAERGRALSASRLFGALQTSLRIAHRMANVFGDFDALLMPMLATAPPPLGSFPTNGDDVAGHWRRMAAFAPGAMLANVAGLPAVTVPFGRDADGLPLPVQILGGIGADLALLDLGQELTRARPFPYPYPLASLP